MSSLYEQVGGFDAILDVCVRWHELCLADPVAEHPFSHPTVHPQHDERLAGYLAEALGGPRLYTGGYGDETYVQRLHARHGVHEELDEACLRLFDQAIADVGIPEPGASGLSAYFRDATVAMRVYSDGGVPDGLPFNHAAG
ncbi:MAG: oxidoreductase [Nocardioides sp.]|nr:oxidoreductase [Nocardioides sp.]